MSKIKKSVISLISYDAHMLPASILSYYDYVDEIILGLDSSRISWSNKKFKFDEEKLYSELKRIDKQGKVFIVEDNFHRSDNPIENDTHERNFLKENCSHDLILSFDADEILVNAKDFFVDFLPLVQDYSDIQLMFTWFLMYKDLGDKHLFIADETGHHFFKKDVQGFSLNKNLHTQHYCRWSNAKKKILSPLAILHYSFCREDKELKDKIDNFGHSAESAKDPFYHTRSLVTEENYMNLHNFKTSNMGAQWPSLGIIETNLITQFSEQEAKLIYA